MECFGKPAVLSLSEGNPINGTYKLGRVLKWGCDSSTYWMRRLRVGMEPISGVVIRPPSRESLSSEVGSRLLSSGKNPINGAVKLVGPEMGCEPSGWMRRLQVGAKTINIVAIRVSEWGKSQQRNWHWQRKIARVICM